MTEFKLDTTGAVEWRDGEVLRWDRLSPFAQGYVEAALRSPLLVEGPDGEDADFYAAFRDLAPSTLAAMLKDCEAVRGYFPRQSAENGERFYHERQRYPNGWVITSGYKLMPLTLHLGDDGLIYQRET